MTAARTEYVQVEGLRLRVRRHGDGPPLLLINGIGAPLEMWQPLVAELGGLHVIAFDLPGCGQSPTARRPRGMRALAGLVATLMRRLGIERAHVLGYSLGGCVAQELAHRHADRVDRLVLCATTAGIGSRPPNVVAAWLMLTPSRYYHPLASEIIVPLIAGGRTRRDEAVLRSGLPLRLAHPPSLMGYGHQLYAAAGFSSRPWLGRLRQRTLVLGGDDDPLCPVANLQYLARTIPHAALEVVPDAGHLLLLDDPARSGRLVREFLTT